MVPSKNQQILLIIPNLGMGGAQRSFVKLADWLSEDYSINIVTFDNSFENVYPVKAPIHYLGKASNQDIRNKIFNFRRRIKKLRQLKMELKPAVCISFLEGADYLNILSDTGEKKIISIRGSKKYDPHIEGIAGFVRRKILIPLLYKKADKIVTASLGLQKEIAETYPALKRNLVTIPNGYSLRTTVQPKSHHSYFILGWAGRFGDEKGLLDFIEVFNECYDRDASFRMLLIGKGPLQSDIKAYFSAKGKTCNVLSRVPEKADFAAADVVICDPGESYEQALSLSDLFLLTSPSEGFPNVLVEAMNLGIAAVSTDCKWGPREILAPELDYFTRLDYPHYGSCGILLPLLSGNETGKKQWVETILFLKNNPDVVKDFAHKGFEGIQRFHQNIIKEEWLRLVEGFVKN